VPARRETKHPWELGVGVGEVEGVSGAVTPRTAVGVFVGERVGVEVVEDPRVGVPVGVGVRVGETLGVEGAYTPHA